MNEQSFGDWQLQQYDVPITPTLCLDNSGFHFPNHPFNFGSMPADESMFLDSTECTFTAMQPVALGLNGAQAISTDLRLQARVDFVAKRLAIIPRIFAEQGQTMFIHRMQFQRIYPSALQDAMSACALYCMKSVATQALVIQNIAQKCQQLIASIDIQVASQLDLLAALQALIIYQTIRLFDGDIRLRACAETDVATMILWAGQLRASMYDADNARLAASGLTDTSDITIDRGSEWQSWLVDESIRRTVITAFMLKGVYSFLKLGHDTPVEIRVYFTAQAALWGAQSDVGWRRAQEEKERLEIWVTHWEEAMTKTTPADLEELGVLVMAMLWGLDTTRIWLGSDFSVKYDLNTN
jgi:hypothetical protein